MGKSEDDKPEFHFARLAGVDNYKWALKIRYALESAGLWDHNFSGGENCKLVIIILKDQDLKDNAKLDLQKKPVDKIIA